MSDSGYTRLQKGLCPIHGSVLDGGQGYGWCEQCNAGWSLPSSEDVRIGVTTVMYPNRDLFASLFDIPPQRPTDVVRVRDDIL